MLKCIQYYKTSFHNIERGKLMINSVLKAIDILEIFSREQPSLSLGDISSRLDLPKSTTHHLLKTLVSRGYIEKNKNGVYALGTNIIPLTQNIRINVDLRDRAAPLLRELSDSCRESVYLTILDGYLGLYIYAVELPGRLLARTAVGDRGHLHSTAVGKAILSCLSTDEVVDIIQQVGLPKFTEGTITNQSDLLDELAEISQRGYARDCAENEISVYCVAAPIFDQGGNVIAACSVSSTNSEILGDRETDISSRVIYTAQEISRRMGNIPSRISSLAGMPNG
jgi:DNA-binding IclR family transcriptional regulator